VFYHLGDLDDALTYALGAGALFDVNNTSAYVQTILGALLTNNWISGPSCWIQGLPCLFSAGSHVSPSKIWRSHFSNPYCCSACAARCLDRYVELQVAAAEAHEDAAIDPRMAAIVERLFERCHADGQYEQAVGVALESRRLDQLERAITGSPGGWGPAACMEWAGALSLCTLRTTSQRAFVHCWVRAPSPHIALAHLPTPFHICPPCPTSRCCAHAQVCS
jgi:26S proteasome regulatory subunit N2